MRRERNDKAPRGVAFAVHDAASGAPCGYVANADLSKVAEPSEDHPVRGRVVSGASWGDVSIELPGPPAWEADFGEGWVLEGKLREVKSKKDSLWVEQRMWIRALNDEAYLHYENPYLFRDGQPVVDAGTTKVATLGAGPSVVEPPEDLPEESQDV